jgi:hypothetical protein
MAVFRFKGWTGNLYLFCIGVGGGVELALVTGLLRYINVLDIKGWANWVSLFAGVGLAALWHSWLGGIFFGKILGRTAPAFGGSEQILRGGVATVV